MKPIKFDRKLSLNKKTISNLNNQEMEKVNGGWPPSYPDTCNTICPSVVGCCGKTYPPLCETS